VGGFLQKLRAHNVFPIEIDQAEQRISSLETQLRRQGSDENVLVEPRMPQAIEVMAMEDNDTDDDLDAALPVRRCLRNPLESSECCSSTLRDRSRNRIPRTLQSSSISS
jgi:hypothetical protein